MNRIIVRTANALGRAISSYGLPLRLAGRTVVVVVVVVALLRGLLVVESAMITDGLPTRLAGRKVGVFGLGRGIAAVFPVGTLVHPIMLAGRMVVIVVALEPNLRGLVFGLATRKLPPIDAGRMFVVNVVVLGRSVLVDRSTIITEGVPRRLAGRMVVIVVHLLLLLLHERGLSVARSRSSLRHAMVRASDEIFHRFSFSFFLATVLGVHRASPRPRPQLLNARLALNKHIRDLPNPRTPPKDFKVRQSHERIQHPLESGGVETWIIAFKRHFALCGEEVAVNGIVRVEEVGEEAQCGCAVGEGARCLVGFVDVVEAVGEVEVRCQVRGGGVVVVSFKVGEGERRHGRLVVGVVWCGEVLSKKRQDGFLCARTHLIL
ncbi:hypothetical protein IWX50DRAFT_703795 [Phyllosticta citricarpa]